MLIEKPTDEEIDLLRELESRNIGMCCLKCLRGYIAHAKRQGLDPLHYTIEVRNIAVEIDDGATVH